jgi:hypothetical protein
MRKIVIFLSSYKYRTVVSILRVADLPGPFGPIKAKIEPVSTLKLTLFIIVKLSNSGKIPTKLEIIIYSNNLYWILK